MKPAGILTMAGYALNAFFIYLLIALYLIVLFVVW